MKKTFSYLGWILFAVSLIAMFWYIKPSKTVDFYGVVKEIEYREEENATYFTTSMLYDKESRIIIKAKNQISVKEVTGEKMELDEIQVGDLLGLDYRGTIDGNDSVITAKWIKVAKDADWSEVDKDEGIIQEN